MEYVHSSVADPDPGIWVGSGFGRPKGRMHISNISRFSVQDQDIDM